MPLIVPILDDRSYEQLRDELRRRIPVYTPEWTDHNPTDPGIALLELFAYLGEDLLFRFNQLPDATKLAFLRLLQLPLRPPAIAEGMVRFTTRDAAVLVPGGTTVHAGKVPLRTGNEVLVQPVDAVGVVRRRADVPDDEDIRSRVERTLQARGIDAEAAGFYTATASPEVPAPPGEGLDPRHSVDGLLWVALLGPARGPAPDLEGATVALGFVPDPVVVGMADVDPCPGAGDEPAAPAMVWRATTPDVVEGHARYLAITVLADSTAGLTRGGVVTVRIPAGTGLPAVDDPALAGSDDLPPEIDDERQDRVLAWLQVGRSDAGAPPILPLSWVGANAALVRHEQEASPELIGVGSGEAGQRCPLVHGGVLAETLRIEVEEAGAGWVEWEPIDDLAAGRGGRRYQLDAEAGSVRFGDGVRSRAPQLGERIRTNAYRYGGGAEGNVAARAVSKVDVAGVKVENPLPTLGGAAAETVAEALDRIPGELRRRDRAVTADDFRELAEATPGADVGRADCLPRFHPDVPGDVAAGVVTVVVWPRQDARHPRAPQPDRTQLRQVCRWLDDRRLVTTELYVVPPTYRSIAVSVGLRVKSGYGTEAVRRWVEQVLEQYLAPLPPYGPEGDGWPLGRRVHGPELEAAALQVEGVEYLEGLRLAVLDGAGTWQEAVTVALERYEVPELLAVAAVDGPAPDPTDDVAPPAPDRTPVPIPVEQLEC